MLYESENPTQKVIRGPLAGPAFVVHRDSEGRLWVASPAIQFTHEMPAEDLRAPGYGFVAFCLRPGATHEQAMALAAHLSDLADKTAFAASFQEDGKSWDAIVCPSLDGLQGIYTDGYKVD